ncbi:MAG: ABC transporter permease, partial [Acidobacteria bacterium]|nr:ABC transporter permease [Acidobacteriota bacterium]
LKVSPAFTAVAVLALAVGIGANTAIFSVVNAVLLRPLPYHDSARLIRVWSSEPAKGIPRMGFAPPDFRDLRDQNQVFEGMAAYYFNAFNLAGTGSPERLRGTIVTPNLFSLLGVAPAEGRGFQPEEETFGRHRIVVLSHGLWQRRFASDPGILNQALQLNGAPYTVVGIMPPQFQFPTDQIELWAPMAFAPDDEMNTRDNHFVDAVARLKPGVALEQARANVDTIARRLEREHWENAGIGAVVESYQEALVGDARRALLILLGAVALVLLIACANVANLLLARAAAREREIAIRAALGAGRFRLLRQLLAESLLLAAIGGALGLLLAYWSLDGLVALGGSSLPRAQEVGIDGRILSFTLGLSLLTGLIFGLAPSLHATRSGLARSLKLPRHRLSASRLLVVSEISLALVLLVGAGLLIRSFHRLLRVNPGFQAEKVWTAQLTLPDSKYRQTRKSAAFIAQLLKEIEALPSVQAAGATTSLPLSSAGGWGKFISIEGRPPATSLEQVPVVQYRQVTPAYFSAMGIRLLKGRLFTERDNPDAAGAAIINSALARRFWPNEDPIGKRIWMGPPESLLIPLLRPGQRFDPFPRLTIVGIVEDVKHDGLSQVAVPEVFHPHFQGGEETATYLFLAVRTTADPLALSSAVRAKLSALDPELPLANVMTMEQRLSDSVSRPRSTMLLLGVFAALALTLASVGLYGVISYSVAQRTHEIGIRMALGARQADVLQLVLKQGIRLVAIGLAVGLAAALALSRLLSSLLFGVSAADPATFFVVSVLLTAIALLASYIPARRAARVDPMAALRYE